MAYNNNYQYGMYYPQYNQMYQNNLQQQVAQVQQQEMPFNEVRFVTSEEAKAHTVYPNRNALLIDKANKIAYFKSADGLGQSSMKPYKFEELDQEQKVVDTNNFISKDVFEDTLKKLTEDFNNQVEELKKSINIKKVLEDGINGIKQ